MTTSYITITETETDPDAPLTSALAKKWRDNPVAIAEGASGAPRIYGGAMPKTHAEFADTLPTLAVTAASTHTITAGIAQITGALTTSSTSYVMAFEQTITNFTGSIRFMASHGRAGLSGTPYLQLRLNGAVVNTWTATASVLREQDVSITPGDVVSWWHYISGGTGSVVTPQYAAASDAFRSSGVYIPYSEWSAWF